MLSFCCVTAAVGLFLKCRDFFHRDFKNSSVGTEAASGGISRNLSEQRSAFGRGRPRARSRAGIQAGTLCCRLCAVLRCPRDPCLVPTPPSATRGGSVHPVLFAISLCAVGQALHSVSPQRSELKATKASPPAPATGSWPVVHLPAALLHPAQWWQSGASPCCGFCALGQVLSAPFQWVFLGIDLSQIAALVGNELCLEVNFVFLIS